MTEDWAGRLAHAAGDRAEVSDAFGVPVLDVMIERWVPALEAAHGAGLTFFDWLTAVDEQEQGFSIVAHIADPQTRPTLHLLMRTKVPRELARLPTATSVYAGASWHERETFEMFGIEFDGHPNLQPLLLPDGFEGHPLRKEFVLAARAAKPWPGAKEPGEREGEAPSRRRMLPPGVPDPGTWGPRPPGTSPAEVGSESGGEPARRGPGAAGARPRGRRPGVEARGARLGTERRGAPATREPGDASEAEADARPAPEPGDLGAESGGDAT